MNFKKQILDFILKNALISSGDRVLAAVSGGVDSMVMLNVLSQLAHEIGFELGAVHFNHKLRGEESERDARFVETIVRNLGIEYYSSTWERENDDLKRSIQTAAREVRFAFFEEVMVDNGYNILSLGHHLDDHIETVLMSVLKGYGINGLSGIPARSGNRVHPLLSVRKDEILRYAGGVGIEFVTDSSNDKTEYLRNRVRLALLPEIEAIFPNYRSALTNLSEEAGELKEYYSRQENSLHANRTIRREKDRIILDIDDILPYFNMLKRYVISNIIKSFDTDIRVSHGIVESVIRLLYSDTGAEVKYAGINIFRESNAIVFQNEMTLDEISIDGSGTYHFDRYDFEVKPCDIEKVELTDDRFIEFVDSDNIIGSLRLRRWRQGDYFCPLGMSKRMKLSDFFVNNKVGISEKLRIPILVDDEKIVWICGYRIDNRVRITADTEHPVKLILNDHR